MPQKKCRLKLITANLAITPTPSSPPATRPLPPPHFSNPSRHRRNTTTIAEVLPRPRAVSSWTRGRPHQVRFPVDDHRRRAPGPPAPGPLPRWRPPPTSTWYTSAMVATRGQGRKRPAQQDQGNHLAIDWVRRMWFILLFVFPDFPVQLVMHCEPNLSSQIFPDFPVQLVI